MKKPLALAAVMAVAIFAFILISPWSLPKLSAAEGSIAVKSDGTVFLAENRLLGSWIYSVGGDNKISRVYQEEKNGGSYIDQLACGEDAVYFIRVTSSDKDKWELVRLDSELENPEIIYTGKASELPSKNGLSVEGEAVYLTCISAGGSSVSVYSLKPDDENPEPVEVFDRDAPDGAVILAASCADNSIYCLLESGLAIEYRSDGVTDYPAGEGSGVSAVSASNGCVWLYSGSESAVYTGSGLMMGDSIPVSSSLNIQSGAATGDTNIVMLAEKEGGDTALVRYNGKIFAIFSSPVIPLSARACFKLPLLCAAGLAILAVLISMAFISLAFKKIRRLYIRLTAASACVFIALFFVMMGAATVISVNGYVETGLTETAIWADSASSALNEKAIMGLSDEGFYGSEAYTAMRQILDSRVFSAATTSGVSGLWKALGFGADASEVDTSYKISGDLLSVSEGAASVSVSGDKQFGLPASQAYNSATSEIINSALETGVEQSGTVIIHGRLTAIHVLPVYSYGEVSALLVANGSAADNPLDASGVLPGAAAWGIAVVVLGTALILLISLYYTRPLKLLCGRMNDISIGRYDIPDFQTREDEIGDLWTVTKELCVALAIKAYETENTMRSFYRFVPRDLEKLLGRASVMEIGLGDATTISSSICIISVNNMDQVRAEADDREFMNFVNDSFSLVSHNIEQHNGILITGDFDLTALKAIFNKTPDDGVRFGLKLLGAAEAGTKSGDSSQEYFLLLHSAEFLYGMAGTEDRAFPFLSSSEIAFLSSISPRFKNTGTKMVITDKLLKSLKNSCSSRYLGFISSDDGNCVYKLYEILDVYSDLEMADRKKIDSKFQEGIRLFYKNDFYLARNAFSAVLKIYPDDGIARWYLYACEYYFSKPESDNIRYDLFGVEE